MTGVTGAAGLVVDVHTHYMPPGGDADGDGDGGWPHLIVDERGGRIVRGGDVFRVVRPPCWDLAARLAEMDEHGIDHQALLPVPVSLDYSTAPGPAAAYARRQNDAIVAAAADHPDRFTAFGSVPLQDVVAAIAELERLRDLGAAGVEIGASVAGKELDDPTLDPFFDAAADLGLRVFVHPLEGGAAMDRCADPVRSFGLGMLTDTGVAASALVFGGVLARRPGLEVCLAHGGGTFAWAYPRLRFRALVGRSDDGGDDAGAQLDAVVRRLWVDGVVLDEGHLHVLGRCFGYDRVVLGSDYPFTLWEPPGDADVFGRGIVAGTHGAAEAAAMRGANGARFLGLPLGTGTP